MTLGVKTVTPTANQLGASGTVVDRRQASSEGCRPLPRPLHPPDPVHFRALGHWARGQLLQLVLDTVRPRCGAHAQKRHVAHRPASAACSPGTDMTEKKPRSRFFSPCGRLTLEGFTQPFGQRLLYSAGGWGPGLRWGQAPRQQRAGVLSSRKGGIARGGGHGHS